MAMVLTQDDVDAIAAAVLAAMNNAPPKVDVHTIKTQTITCAAAVTVLASVGTAHVISLAQINGTGSYCVLATVPIDGITGVIA